MNIRLANSDSEVEQGLYPDNSPVIDIAQLDLGRYSHEYMLLQPYTMAEFFTGMMLADALAERGKRVRNLVLPCVPGARQDRLNAEGDALFTLKYVAKAINAQNFDRVVIADPHSLVTPALIDRCVVAPLHDLLWPAVIHRVFNSVEGIIAPDVGAGKRAEDVAALMGSLPVHQGFKHRDPATNRLSGFSVDGLRSGGHYLVVDDLCDAGGTFLGLAEKIRQADATADLYVTHGLFTKGTEQLAKAYNKAYTTDTIPYKNTRVTIIPILERLLNYVG